VAASVSKAPGLHSRHSATADTNSKHPVGNNLVQTSYFLRYYFFEAQATPGLIFAITAVPYLYLAIPPTLRNHLPTRCLRCLTVCSATLTCTVHKHAVSAAQTGECIL
jgi:hypothetical protein